jgi:Tol biopolymer transport system component
MTFAPFLIVYAPSAACPHVIYIMDLRTHETTTIPGSEGLWAPRWSADGNRIVAQTTAVDGLMIYEITSRKWSELIRTPGTVVGFPQWSKDGNSVYYQSPAMVYRIRVRDHTTEKVADLSGIHYTGFGGYWLAMTPDGSPLILRDASLHEIYALDFEAP